MVAKISLLQDYCDQYGMTINEEKTKFFVINGSNEDSNPIRVNGLLVRHCEHYIYLGSPFTSDGSISSSVRVHANKKMPHVLKFVSFMKKNNDIPFVVKRRVFEAALLSAIIYGCESWLNADLKPIVKLYNWALKQLLSVRRSTCNDVCYIESGYPPIEKLIKQRQRKFFRNMIRERRHYDDDPLMFAVNKILNSNTHTSRYIKELIDNDVDDVRVAMTDLKQRLLLNNSSRRVVYKEINPDLNVHYVYSGNHSINEMHRVAFTQFRVSGHSLAIETGRWNRRGRGRLPVEERLCRCGGIQDEKHVITHCVHTQHIRNMYGFNTINELFSDRYEPDTMCKIIYDILRTYVNDR